jgi:hypothetical protein
MWSLYWKLCKGHSIMLALVWSSIYFKSNIVIGLAGLIGPFIMWSEGSHCVDHIVWSPMVVIFTNALQV